MTLYNSARYFRAATDSILAQTDGNFVLVMLDDGSSDEVEGMAREYETRDRRVRYWRHAQRLGMVPTWREVVEIARREYPEAEYFAWVSDHDLWEPQWLARMAAELDAHPDAVLAYSQTLRIDEQGAMMDKEPRMFDTSGVTDRRDRWRRFAWSGFGSGDMVYGLMRRRALEAAGVFRPVLNPDRLLIAELTLRGQILQVTEPLWSRRQARIPSLARQSESRLARAETPPIGWPATLQHAVVLRQEGIGAGMIATYVIASGWRATRKTETSKRIGRGVDNVHFVKKLIKKGFHHGVYYTLVGARTFVGRSRRVGRKAIYELLTLTHRLGLRGNTRIR
jgi:hypothetical protein